MNEDEIKPSTTAIEARPSKTAPEDVKEENGDGGVPSEPDNGEIAGAVTVDEIVPIIQTNLTLSEPANEHITPATTQDTSTHPPEPTPSPNTASNPSEPSSSTATEPTTAPLEESNEAKPSTHSESSSSTTTTEPATNVESINDSTEAVVSSTSSYTTTSTSNPPPITRTNSSPNARTRGSTIQFANGGNPTNTPPAPFSLNSSTGIEEEGSASDSEEGMRRKGKRKERGYSKIIVEHKKNLLGEIIYKGHPSWVLMLNIQTGIRNAVGKSMHQRSFNNPKTLSPSHSQPQPSPPVQPATLSTSNSTPVSSSDSSVRTPPTLQFGPDGVLRPDQFEKIEEFYASSRVLQFPSAGSSQTIPHSTGPFKFKDYCPHAFRFLRHRFGIDQADYMVALCNTQKNGENALRELPTPGKSGSLFFFSHDMRFILKTIPKSEAKLLRLLLPSYVEHIAKDENTLLPKFYGLHRVKPHKGRQVRFVVMSNVFQTRKKIHERYDLKGSTLGRAATEEEKKKESVTYKDLDFRERHMKIQIGPQRKVALLEQLQRDCKFLGQLNIMDYSLLIGIHYEDRENDRSGPPSPLPPAIAAKLNAPADYFTSIFQSNDGGMKGVDEAGNPTGTYYYMGIIDILMLYSIRKKVEHTYKTLRYKKEGTEISSISPPEYANRFYEFVAASIV